MIVRESCSLCVSFGVVDTYKFLKLKYAVTYFRQIVFFSHDCAN